MPGLYGFTCLNQNASSLLESMAKSMHLYDHFIQDDLFIDRHIAASRTHIGNIGPKHTPVSKDNLFLWLEGEAYNFLEVAALFNIDGSSFEDVLIEAYKLNLLNDFLSKIDGYFVVAIYDPNNEKILLISDRYGMRMLYWFNNERFFAWGSEVKSILSLSNIEAKLDQNSLNTFMDLGYLMGEHTWFQQIKLVKPSSIIEFDINKRDVTHQYYWKWSNIQGHSVDFDEAVNLLGKQLLSAVEKRSYPVNNTGVSLSGGLDSRAILAAYTLVSQKHKSKAFTFGKKGCDDIKIAKKVIVKTNWEHYIYHLKTNNWFNARFPHIWNTDGMLEITHMHGSEFLKEWSSFTKINLNGYAGDAVLGGSFLTNAILNQRINISNADSYYSKYSHLAQIDDDYYDLNHIEPNLYMNRIRRFTNMGIVSSLTHVDQRMPFYDNNIVEQVFSLSDSYRLNNRLYTSILIKFFPDFFETIPWQKTGNTITGKNISKKSNYVTLAANRFLTEIGVKNNKRKHYTDYAKWINSKNVHSQIRSIFENKHCISNDLINENIVKSYLIPHLNNEADYTTQILRLVTIEIYLQRVFNKKII